MGNYDNLTNFIDLFFFLLHWKQRVWDYIYLYERHEGNEKSIIWNDCVLWNLESLEGGGLDHTQNQNTLLVNILREPFCCFGSKTEKAGEENVLWLLTLSYTWDVPFGTSSHVNAFFFLFLSLNCTVFFINNTPFEFFLLFCFFFL